MSQQIEIVEDGEVFDRVTELGECGENVGLSRPIRGLQERGQILIERRRLNGIEQDEDFEFLFHAQVRW